MIIYMKITRLMYVEELVMRKYRDAIIDIIVS